MNRINTSFTNIRTDLVLELDTNNNYTEVEKIDNIIVSKTIINNKNNKYFNRKNGNYITIEFKDITNYEDREAIGKTLESNIKKLLEINNINNNDKGLIIGLGNSKSTPDSLGPLVIQNILVTRHLFILNTNIKKGIRNISAISPNVMGNTGIETADIIKGIVNNIKPKFIIVIDSLCASSLDRLNKTIQLTDTGINPGSGIGNNRKEISKDTLKIPVIAIGVPTVVDISTIVNNSLNYLLKHLSYQKNNKINEKDNYLDILRNREVNDIDKNIYMGLLGSLSNQDKYILLNEVLSSINYNLVVTVNEIDYLIDKLSNVISNAINNSLHRSIDNY